jgi:hypothetical protein
MRTQIMNCFSVFSHWKKELFIIADKTRAKGVGRQKVSVLCKEKSKFQQKLGGDGNLSHTRWIRGMSYPGEREGDRV